MEQAQSSTGELAESDNIKDNSDLCQATQESVNPLENEDDSSNDKKTKKFQSVEDIFLMDSETDESIIYENTKKNVPNEPNIQQQIPEEKKSEDLEIEEKEVENPLPDAANDSEMGDVAASSNDGGQSQMEIPEQEAQNNAECEARPSTSSAQPGGANDANAASKPGPSRQGPGRKKRIYRRKRKIVIEKPKIEKQRYFHYRRFPPNPTPVEVTPTIQSLPPRDGMVFEIGARLEVEDNFGKWYPSKILDLRPNEVLIHFEKWSNRFDEWIELDSTRLRAIQGTAPSRKSGKKSPHYEDLLYMLGDQVLVKDTEGNLHHCQIMNLATPGYITVKNLNSGIVMTLPEREIISIPQHDQERLMAEASQHKGGIPLNTWKHYFPHLEHSHKIRRKIAHKAFIIKEDHNQFKCSVCGKSFRKETLLQSHIKHYHMIRKKSSHKIAKPFQRSLQSIQQEAISHSSFDSREETLSSTTSPPSSFVNQDLEEPMEDQPMEDLIRCVCNLTINFGLMIQCDRCEAWQHGDCLNITQETEVPNNYLCFLCAPQDSPETSPQPSNSSSEETSTAASSTDSTPQEGLGWYSGNLPSFSNEKNRQRVKPTASDVDYVNRLVVCAEETFEILPTLQHKINMLKYCNNPETRQRLQISIAMLNKTIEQRNNVLMNHYNEYVKANASILETKTPPTPEMMRLIKLILRHSRP